MTLFDILKQQKLSCIGAPLLKMTEALLQLCVPPLMAFLIDHVFEMTTLQILEAGVLLVVCAIAAVLVSLAGQILCACISTSLGSTLRVALFEQLLMLNEATLDTIGRGSMAQRLRFDTQQVEDGVNMFFRLILRSPLVSIGATIAVCILYPIHGLIFATTLLLCFIIVVLCMRLASKATLRAAQALDVVEGGIHEVVSGLITIKSLGLHTPMRTKRLAEISQLTQELARAERLGSLINPLTLTLIYLGIGGIIIQSIWLAPSGDLSKGTLVAVLSYATLALVELVKFAILLVTMAKTAASWKRIREALELPSSSLIQAEVTDAIASESIKSPEKPLLRVEHLSFTYPHHHTPVLNDISFELYPGESLGIIGVCGSGKTTLVRLISGEWSGFEGSITLNGHRIDALKPERAVPNCVVAEQNPRIISGTIRDNLLLFHTPQELLRDEASTSYDMRLIEALKKASAEELIQTPEGLERSVGIHGSALSGGQKQRLMLARSFLQGGLLRIFDDATSALDFRTEANVIRQIHQLTREGANILISQRVASLMHADRILVLHHGRIVGIGTDEELMKTCPLWNELKRSQGLLEDTSSAITEALQTSEKGDAHA